MMAGCDRIPGPSSWIMVPNVLGSILYPYDHQPTQGGAPRAINSFKGH